MVDVINQQWLDSAGLHSSTVPNYPCSTLHNQPGTPVLWEVALLGHTASLPRGLPAFPSGIGHTQSLPLWSLNKDFLSEFTLVSLVPVEEMELSSYGSSPWGPALFLPPPPCSQLSPATLVGSENTENVRKCKTVADTLVQKGLWKLWKV